MRRAVRIGVVFAMGMVTCCGTGIGSAATAPAHAAAMCTSAKNPALATKLSNDIPSALNGRAGAKAVAVLDKTTGTSCALNADTQFQSASVVKVTILSELLRQAQDANRGLTANEKSLATKMITESDNDAASALWGEIGQAGFKQMLAKAGMSETTVDSTGYWGKTHITAGDELKQLSLLTTDNSVLTADSRAYVLDLMTKVVSDQRWGTPVGAPSGITVHVKNGWVDRADGQGWRINSLGAFNGNGKDYEIVVLTQGNSSESYGHTTIEGAAKLIHRDINS